jgi:hypothetical protein
MRHDPRSTAVRCERFAIPCDNRSMGEDDLAMRAARFSRIPGVTIDEASKRFKVKKSAISKARKSVERLSPSEIVLAAVTTNGTKKRGRLTANELASIANWLDYVEKAGSTPDDVREILHAWVREGILALDGDEWKLVTPWP